MLLSIDASRFNNNCYIEQRVALAAENLRGSLKTCLT